MSKIDEQGNIDLEVAVKVRDLRKNMVMNQREFVSLIDKPRSATRIVDGSKAVKKV